MFHISYYLKITPSMKVSHPVSVTDSGMTMLVRLVQPEKAQHPISVTESGMTMLVRPVQPEKADSQITVTESGLTVVEQPEIILFVAVSMMALLLSRESYFLLPSDTQMLVRPVQPEKAFRPIAVTESGMTML